MRAHPHPRTPHAFDRDAPPPNLFSPGWELSLALRYLRAPRKNGGIAVIASMSFISIAIAVAVLIVAVGVMAGFRGELMDRVLSFNGHAYVQGAPLTRADRHKILARLKEAPGVTSVTPLTENQALLRVQGSTSGIIIRGIEPSDLASMTHAFASLSSEATTAFASEQGADEVVIVGDALAKRLGITAGDYVNLYAPSGSVEMTAGSAGGEKAYQVVGMFDSGTADFDSAFVFMPLRQAQVFFQRPETWDVVEIKVAEPDKVGDVYPALKAAAGPGAIVSDWRERLAAFWEMLNLQSATMGLILSIIVAVAALNLTSGVVMLVKNKTRDIAILRTIGASPNALIRVFFYAGATLGAAGTVAGITVGLVICANIGSIQAFVEHLVGVQLFNADVYKLDAIPARVDIRDVVLIAAWSMLTSSAASLYPSWQASRMHPIDALRD